MAIPILEQRKRLRKFFPVLVIIILITLFNLWRGAGSKSKTPSENIAPVESKGVEIDWPVVKSKELDNLNLFQEISEFKSGGGRNNPFEPY